MPQNIGSPIVTQLHFHPHDHMMRVDHRFGLDLLWWQQWGRICHSNLSEIEVHPYNGHLARELQPPGFWPCDEWVSHYMIVAYMPRRSSLKSDWYFWTVQVCNNVCVNTGCFFTLLHFSGEEKKRKKSDGNRKKLTMEGLLPFFCLLPNDKLSAALLPRFLLPLAVCPQYEERKIYVVFKVKPDKFL